ncbi:peptidylprolyl isomerase [candidate division WWE3 bacterium]|uniref:Peptidyl-prolyl cis-trans isomerase n=1 Tax=candidate division WWE3 bacterium TaxID=2053526 RepID=A0A955RWK5_UNCKA|nr:peptidylprolyl isomerase [candidate division WWE3 bacterium]
MEQDIQQYNSAPEMILTDGVDYQAQVTTNKGTFTIDLNEDSTPITVNNFVFLARKGFYANVPFHRVMEGFMIQTGDPTGTGSGGPGYRFEDEPFEGEYTRGTVAMANAGPDTNGSQFFIMHADNQLPPNYVIFGNVVDGLDVVDTIATSPVTSSPRGELSVPLEDIYIESVEIIEN